MAGDQVPIGGIIIWTDPTPPTDYLECIGQAVSRATYSVLFALFGTKFGAGDESTTFNLPDLRGRAPIGVGTGAGLTARALAANVGAETHTLSSAETPDSSLEGSIKNKPASSGQTPEGLCAGARGAGIAQSELDGAADAHANMQPSLALHYIIRVTIA